MTQLADVAACLSQKIACLGFGNMFAIQLTRLRLAFDGSNLSYPLDLADTLTEPTIVEFLHQLLKALQHEDSILHIQGSRGAGILLAVLHSICPDDLRVEIQNQFIYQGVRTSIVLNVTKVSSDRSLELKLESTLKIHTNHFSSYWIAKDFDAMPSYMTYKWHGWLYAVLENHIQVLDRDHLTRLRDSIVNVLLALELVPFARYCAGRQGRIESPMSESATANLRTITSPVHKNHVRLILREVLLAHDILTQTRTLSEAWENLGENVELITRSKQLSCRCSSCSTIASTSSELDCGGRRSHDEEKGACYLYQHWRCIDEILKCGFRCLFIRYVEENVVVSPRVIRYNELDFIGLLKKAMSPPNGQPQRNFSCRLMLDPCVVSEWVLELFQPPSEYISLFQDWPDCICVSSGFSTIYPHCLEYPSMEFRYYLFNLVAGKLHYKSVSYASIKPDGVPHRMLWNDSNTGMVSSDGLMFPSGRGGHDSLNFSLYPDISHGRRVLKLRTTLRINHTSIHFNFRDLLNGMMGVQLTTPCDHYLRSALQPHPRVMATSVEKPAAPKWMIGLTLTSGNPEAQFLCCSNDLKTLYQGNCCLTCAVKEALEGGYEVVIGAAM